MLFRRNLMISRGSCALLSVEAQTLEQGQKIPYNCLFRAFVASDVEYEIVWL